VLQGLVAWYKQHNVRKHCCCVLKISCWPAARVQMARLRSQSLDFGAAKAMGAGGKDADMSPFSAAGKLLEPRGAGRPPRWVGR
jgi:hypothetical protein